MAALALIRIVLAAPAVAAAGNTGKVHTAHSAMARNVTERAVALIADIDADAEAVTTGALAAAAQITLRVIAGAPGLALQRIDARTMIAVAARRIVSAEALIAPEQTAHLADGMIPGILAQIGFAAAAVLRIAEMFDVLLALGMLRLRHAVRIGLRGMAVLAGVVTFHAADRNAVIAVTADVAGITALARAMVPAVAYAVTPLAAGSLLMHQTVAVEVALLVAQRLGMIRAVAGEMAQGAGSGLMPEAVAQQMTRHAAVSITMIQLIGHAVARHAAGSRFVLTHAVVVAFSAASRRSMILAIAIHMSPVTAGGLLVVHAVTGKVARRPAGLRTVVINSVVLFMARFLTGRLRGVIRSQRAGSAADQQAQRQHQRNNLFHV